MSTLKLEHSLPILQGAAKQLSCATCQRPKFHAFGSQKNLNLILGWILQGGAKQLTSATCKRPNTGRSPLTAILVSMRRAKLRWDYTELLCQNTNKILESLFQENGIIDEYVAHRIKIRWLKWRSDTRVICDTRMPTEVKGKFSITVIRPRMSYESDIWPLKCNIFTRWV